MRAMLLESTGPLRLDRLRPVDLPRPEPGPRQVRLRVAACGVCRTDLHLVLGEVPPPALPLVPGHQVVGYVDAVGGADRRFREGDRVGVSWLQWACGSCRFCRTERENLCPEARFTGFHSPGGYSEALLAPEAFCYSLPVVFSDHQAAPLLCAGILGYRAFRLSRAGPGDRLGMVGFGGSAHITLQVARHRGCEVDVATRSPGHRSLALELGASSAGDLEEVKPSSWDAAILFAPAGSLIPRILRRLRPAGTLAVAAIRVGTVPGLDYERELFEERVLTTVTASTRRDGEEFLEIAGDIPIRTEFRVFGLEEANEALRALEAGRLNGAAVLSIS